MKKVIEVVGAVIHNEQGQILCALRAPDMSLPDVWEFPGGKIEPGEEPRATLVREVQEELGCAIDVAEMVEDTTHEYETIVVRLLTFHAAIVEGAPTPREHAELRWLFPQELESLEWAPADIPAVQTLIREQSP